MFGFDEIQIEPVHVLSVPPKTADWTSGGPEELPTVNPSGASSGRP